MSALENIELGKELIYLARLSPTIRLIDWELDTSVGPTTYRHRLPANFVDSFYYNLTPFSLVDQSALSSSGAERYAFNRNTGYVYADLLGKSTNFLSNYVRCNYEVSFASKEIAFFRDPTDDSTEVTQYLPGFSTDFSLSKGVSNVVDGIMPAVTTSVKQVNVSYEAAFMFRRSTLSKKKIIIYVMSGERTASNALVVFEGFITGVTFNDQEMTYSINDRIFNLDGNYNYRNVSDAANRLLTVDNVATLDPSKDDTYVRTVYGLSVSVELANISFVQNKAYGVGARYVACQHFDPMVAGNTNSSRLAYTIVSQSTVGSVVTMTLNNTDALNTNDELLVSTNDHLGSLESVNHTTKVITFLKSAASAATPANGSSIYRDRIAGVLSVSPDGGNSVRLTRVAGPSIPNGSYLIDAADDLLAVRINASADIDPGGVGANGIKLVARIYGEKTTINSTGSNAGLYNLANSTINLYWHRVLYEYLVAEVKIHPSDIHEPSFTQFDSDLNNQPQIGFTITKEVKGQLPKHRDVIASILSSNFCSLYQRIDGKLAIAKIAKIDATDFELTKDDIISISYNEDYLDTAFQTLTELAYGDVKGGLNFNPFAPVEPVSSDSGGKFSSFQRKEVSDIYSSAVIKTSQSLAFSVPASKNHAQKNFYIYAYPIAILSVDVSIPFLGKNIGDTVTIKRNLLPGVFSTTSISEIKGRIIGISFNGSSVNLKIWTQQGIQDSQGVW